MLLLLLVLSVYSVLRPLPSPAAVPGLLHLSVLVLALAQALVLVLASLLALLLVLVPVLLLVLPPLLRNLDLWPVSRHTLVSGSLVLVNQIQAQSHF